MTLRVHAFRATLATNRGPYGVMAQFSEGLNVIRAENTSGKSALINGILYALGLEILAGKRGVGAMKPVLRSAGEYGGDEFHVVESFVELEISNSAHDVVTVRRFIAGERDPRLVEVLRGAAITREPGVALPVDTFFVGVEGAAQRERGFHRFLSEFLGLDLPYVKRYQGEDVPLYIECVAPLMLIEQLRGWSGIQATLPQSYGIRNVARLALEYLLKLDVIENEKRRVGVAEQASKIRERWTALRASMVHVSSQVGGNLVAVPNSPVSSLPDDPWIAVGGTEEGAFPMRDLLVARRERLLEYSDRASRSAPSANESEAALNAQETELMIAQAELAQLRIDMRAQETELQSLADRSRFLKADIQRNRDVKRLRDFGAEVGLAIAQDRCPTCDQPVQDSLVVTETAAMSIDENLSFLAAEAEAVALISGAGAERLLHLQSRVAAKALAVSNLRSTIRDLRSDLLESRSVSVASIREQLHLQDEVARLEVLGDEFDELTADLRELADEWRENRSRHAELPTDYFSAEDRAKLDALSTRFAEQVTRFGYRSTGVSRLHISEDNYHPICDEFDILAGASASDNIRVIWAYTLALLQVSQSHGGNHWNLVVFDEPEQQRMRDASADELYVEIGQMDPSRFQMIIATSAPADVTNRRLAGLPHRFLEFGEKMVRPI